MRYNLFWKRGTAPTSNDESSTEEMAKFEKSIEQCRLELEALQSEGQRQQVVQAAEIKQLENNLVTYEKKLEEQVRCVYHSLYVACIKDVYNNTKTRKNGKANRKDDDDDNDDDDDDEEKPLPPPYVVKNQALLCHALHQIYVLDEQIDLLAQNQVGQFLKRQVLQFTDEKFVQEIQLLNLMANVADDKDDLEQSYQTRLQRQQEEIQLLLEQSSPNNNKYKTDSSSTSTTASHQDDDSFTCTPSSTEQNVGSSYVSQHMVSKCTTTDTTTNDLLADHRAAIRAISARQGEPFVHIVVPRSA